MIGWTGVWSTCYQSRNRLGHETDSFETALHSVGLPAFSIPSCASHNYRSRPAFGMILDRFDTKVCSACIAGCCPVNRCALPSLFGSGKCCR